MSTYILTISTKYYVPEGKVKQIIANHENGQDVVLTEYTDDDIQGGFTVTKDDNLAEKVVAAKPKIKVDKKVKKAIYRQSKIVKDGAKYSKDTSITKGVKPYEPK